MPRFLVRGASHGGIWPALGAIALWASLATLGVRLARIPPFELTALALAIGSLPSWPRWRTWRVGPAALALGVWGLFGFHLLLFVALRHAPPLEANLVNYLWPLLMVLLAPAFVPGVRLSARHGLAALLGFAGAALAILGGRAPHGGLAWGYLPALGSACVWATYSLGSRRLAEQGRGFATPAVGLFGLVSAALAFACHVALEPMVWPTPAQWGLVVAMGLGPLGVAFLWWDRALKTGDPRTVGVLGYLTPVASTAVLALAQGRTFTPALAGGAALIVAAAALATFRPAGRATAR